MKSIKIFSIAVLLIAASSVQSQLSVSVHLGSPPTWGPVGYSSVHYYYLPDIEAYYDVDAQLFIYFVGNQWVRRSYLPTRYRNYDLYHGYKVVMTDYRGHTPYTYFKQHKVKYAKGYHGTPQRNYRDANRNDNDNKSRQVKQVKNQRNDNHDSRRGNGPSKPNKNNGNNGHDKGGRR